jgi:signal transduction histidine kinase
LLIAGIAASATAIYWFLVRGMDGLDAPIHIPWLLLVILFYLSEIYVVHLQLRRDAHSFSLSEVPLILALFFATPLELITAQVLGSAIAFLLTRKQALVKATFNLSQIAFQSAVSLLVFQSIVGDANPIGWHGWAAALLTTCLASLCSVTLINLAMYLSGERLQVRGWKETLGLATAVTVANTCLALVCVVLSWLDWHTSWLLVVPVAVVFASYRGYSLQRTKHESLEALYESSRSLQLSPDAEAAVLELLSRARKMFRADLASVIFVPDRDGEPAFRTVLGPGDQVSSFKPVDLDPTEGVWARVVAEGTGVLIPRPIANRRLRTYFEAQGIRDAMVAPLHLDDRILGTMMVGNRLGDVSTFDLEDLKLFETLANHASVSLENARLVERLGESLAHLTEMNRMKDDFVASVSHELRTPLTSILGYVKTLLRPDAKFAESDRADFLQAIERQSERLRDLIEDLLIVSRIESASDTASAGPIDLHVVIAEVMAELNDRTRGRDMTIDIRPGIPAASSDKGKLHQIISNLVDNALKYSPEGTPIVVSVAREGRGVTVSVTDRGQGIPAELHEHIFERFYQVDQSSTREKGGTGLGLYICRKLAEMLGGRLWLERSDTTGSTFSLWVPLASSSQPPDLSDVGAGPIHPAGG